MDGFVDIETVGCDKDGLVTFGAIPYTMSDVGTHIYRISEVREKEIQNILYVAEDIRMLLLLMLISAGMTIYLISEKKKQQKK